MKHKISLYLSYWNPYYGRKFRAWERAFKERGLAFSCEGDKKGVMLYSDDVPDSEIAFIYRDIYSRF